MLVIDVNVVLAVARQDHPMSPMVTQWWDTELIARGTEFGVPVGVWASYLRIVTNRKIFEVPTPLEEAFAFVRAVTSYPTFVAAEPGQRHIELLERVCVASDATGPLVPDAVLAAITLEHGGAVATLDRDFARFSDVRTVRPGA